MIPSSPVHKQWSPQNDVYCEDVVQEFSALLGAEMYVDLTKLRQISRYGIPDELRGDVWKYLLKVESADRTNDMETYKLNEAEYFQLRPQTHEYTNKIRGEVSRLQARIQKPLLSKVYEDVIGAYLNYNKQAEFSSSWVHLCTPFVLVLEREVEVFYCFKNLMQIIDDYFYNNPLERQITRFQTLFRMLIPDLNDYFEEEQVSLFEWSSSWLTNLFAKEMPPSTLISLWDLYFGTTNFMDLHLYMCIAILQQNRERLEELENSEIKAFLSRLPEMDIFSIRQTATDLQHQAMETLADQL